MKHCESVFQQILVQDYIENDLLYPFLWVVYDLTTSFKVLYLGSNPQTPRMQSSPPGIWNIIFGSRESQQMNLHHHSVRKFHKFHCYLGTNYIYIYTSPFQGHKIKSMIFLFPFGGICMSPFPGWPSYLRQFKVHQPQLWLHWFHDLPIIPRENNSILKMNHVKKKKNYTIQTGVIGWFSLILLL